MPRIDHGELVPLDPEIERTLRKLRKEAARRRLFEIFENIAQSNIMVDLVEPTMEELRKVPIGQGASMVAPTIERAFNFSFLLSR